MSFDLPRVVTVGLAAALLVATAADALAIRNRYTNEQNEGFTGLLVEGFSPFYEGAQPLYRPYRRGRDTWPGYDGPDRRYGDPRAPYPY